MFSRAHFERDLEDEIQLHVSLRADALQRTGMPRTEAERLPRIELGNVQMVKENVRKLRPLLDRASPWAFAIAALTMIAVIAIAKLFADGVMRG